MRNPFKNSTRKLDGFSSLFLDIVRIICAMIVLLEHCGLVITPAFLSLPVAGLRHGAVIIFFVLSGFVIAHTTSMRQRSFADYLVSRLSRLYSIYIPAILVTIICAVSAFFINPDIYFQYDRGSNVSRYLLTLFFCNELWFTSSAPPINSPFWSLSFEFWYYILFALIYYKANNFKGVISILLVCLVIGPKILVMFPIWCLGWLAYKIPNINLNVTAARIASVVLFALALTTAKIIPAYPGVAGYKPLYMANAFVSDMATGMLAAASIWILTGNFSSRQEVPVQASSKFRFFANLTYPVYLLHYPVLVVCSTILHKYNLGNTTNYCAGLIITLLTCIFLGSYFEKRKNWWDIFFGKIIYEEKLSFRCGKPMRGKSLFEGN